MNLNLTLIAQALAFAALIWLIASKIWPPLLAAIAIAMSGSRNWPNSVRPNHVPKPTSAALAGPRMTTDRSSANASQNEA